MFLTDNDYQGIRVTYRNRTQSNFCDAHEHYVAHVPEGRTMGELEGFVRQAGYPLEGDDRSWPQPYATIDETPFGSEVVDGTACMLHRMTVIYPNLD